MGLQNISRRHALIGLGATALATRASFSFAQSVLPPITIVLSQSPWFASFQATVERYQSETGNVVNLDVNPFDGLLEKQRNSVRASSGDFDILVLNSQWFVEMYAGGFLTAIHDIDPGFKLDADIFTLGDTVYYDAASKTMTPAGNLMTLPIQPNVPLIYYRGDLYEEKGLRAPETFADLLNNSKALHNPPDLYGIVQRGARDAVSYDFAPYLYGMGGNIFKDQSTADYTVVLDNDVGNAALDYYINLAKEAGHPQTASQDQAQVVQAMVTGHSGHASLVVAAWSQMDDPAKSAVVDKVEFAPTPHADRVPTRPPLGHWLGGIARNIPDDRKRAALEFFKWFQTKEAQLVTLESGGVPLNAAVYKDEALTQERKYRWMNAVSASLPTAVNSYSFAEAAEVTAVLNVGLNRAIAGEIAAKDAIRAMANEIRTIMRGHNYKSD